MAKTKQGLLTSTDIMKGYTAYKGNQDIWTTAPIQTLPLEQKDEEWIKWNADWFENIALRELPKKSKRLQKLYNLAGGVINKSDYIYNPQGNDVSSHLGIIGGENDPDLLNQFFPIAPNIMKIFLGRFLAMDKKIIIHATDPESINETLQYREDQMKQIFQQHFVQRKQMELIRQGIVPGDGSKEDVYTQEMQMAAQIAEAQVKFKKFRTQAAEWGQHFVDKFSDKLYFDEMSLEMFGDMLTADECIVALNMHEDDFYPEVLRTMQTYVNISPNEKYYSKANFIVNMEFMSIPDIINKFRKKLTAEQIELLEKQYTSTFSKDIMFAGDVGRYSSSAYYNTSKTYDQNMRFSVNARENLSDKTVENFMMSLQNGGSGYYTNYSDGFNNPKLIRVSRIWWASIKKIGLLTKIEEGNPSPVIEQIDENFLVTEKPEYDNSLLKEKSAKTLIKGEHVDWTDVVEWRYVEKIGENLPYYTTTPNTEFENIYIDGQPVRFQFKGKNNIFEAKPPIEGCKFSNKNTISNSLIESIRPWQIDYNIIMNKMTKTLPYDYGKILLMNQSTVKKNSLYQQDGIEPLIEYMDSLKETKIGLIDDSRETAADTTGRMLEPRVVDMSTVDQATFLLQLGILIKNEAFQSIGISPQAAADVGRSESATGVNQAVQASNNQLEPIFDQYLNKFMPRVWQMILEAGQYYTTNSPSFSDTYMTRDLENTVFQVLRDDLLLRDLLVMAFSKPDLKQLVNDLKQLAKGDNTLQASFLERASTLLANTPSEIMDKLTEAEAKRMQEKQQEYQNQQQLQQQQLQAAEKLQQETIANENKKFYDNLANERLIAEIQANAAQDTNAPTPMNETDAAKLDAQNTANANKQQTENQKLQQNERMHNDNIDLERRKIESQDRKAQLDYATAVENKNKSDLKFIQLQKNKAKAK